MELVFGINTMYSAKHYCCCLECARKNSWAFLSVSCFDLLLGPEEISGTQLKCHCRFTDLSVPLNAQATNSPGTPGIEEKMSITKYGMSWGGRSKRATQAIKIFLGNGREVAASEHAAEFWFCSTEHEVSDFEQRGCRLAKNHISAAAVPE